MLSNLLAAPVLSACQGCSNLLQCADEWQYADSVSKHGKWIALHDTLLAVKAGASAITVLAHQRGPLFAAIEYKPGPQ
jgi:hypothetical protein